MRKLLGSIQQVRRKFLDVCCRVIDLLCFLADLKGLRVAHAIEDIKDEVLVLADKGILDEGSLISLNLC
jgi:hypothetical protein